ncbi:hypothetical protein CYMTET_25933 [Cymbomonas tetramitiformis]|uniref:F-box domain-containing protein n=1 Tax=Cymbomonas tetramitiformis TaxID=36881 RepID=A0AAE0FT81_9CHLO|nr:hypothetical protein CYMTET_25933 [Cymbomonas tetramitiformis]
MGIAFSCLEEVWILPTLIWPETGVCAQDLGSNERSPAQSEVPSASDVFSNAVVSVPRTEDGLPPPYNTCPRGVLTSPRQACSKAPSTWPPDWSESLGADLLLRILGLLSSRYLVRCEAVCRKWRKLISEHGFWKVVDLGESPHLSRITTKEVQALILRARGHHNAPIVEEIDLSFCRKVVWSQLRSCIQDCPKLRTLKLVGVGGVDESSMSELQDLGLTHVEVSVRPRSRNEQTFSKLLLWLRPAWYVRIMVRELNLSRCGIEAAEMQLLAAALPDNPFLEALHLAENSITDSIAQGLTSTLTLNSSLTALDLTHNFLGPGFCAQLQGVLAPQSAQRQGSGVTAHSKCRLRCVLLRSNQLLGRINVYKPESNEALRCLSTIMGRSPSLTHLDLTNNHIGPKGLKLLTAGLRQRPACFPGGVRQLLLGQNFVVGRTSKAGHEEVIGLRALGEVLAEGSALVMTDLSYNAIGPHGADALVSAMLTAPSATASLTSLQLAGNHLGPQGAGIIAQLLHPPQQAQDGVLGSGSSATTAEDNGAPLPRCVFPICELDLSRNQLGIIEDEDDFGEVVVVGDSSGVAKLAASLIPLDGETPRNTTLRKLVLASNQLAPIMKKEMVGITEPGDVGDMVEYEGDMWEVTFEYSHGLAQRLDLHGIDTVTLFAGRVELNLDFFDFMSLG